MESGNILSIDDTVQMYALQYVSTPHIQRELTTTTMPRYEALLTPGNLQTMISNLWEIVHVKTLIYMVKWLISLCIA